MATTSFKKNEKTQKWYFSTRYKTASGEIKQKKQEGFSTRNEAKKAAEDFLNLHENKPSTLFKNIVTHYLEDQVLDNKLSTYNTAKNVIEVHILPFFGEMPINLITKETVKSWQREMKMKTKKNGKLYSPITLRKIHTRLSLIFNYAVENYSLPKNPAREAHSIGQREKNDFNFWSLTDYILFKKEVAEEPRFYYAFEVLFWTGMREGELLALTREDVDLSSQTIRINKTYYRSEGKDIITPPKTRHSIRTVPIPKVLCEELDEYFSMLYNLEPSDRIFCISKKSLLTRIEKYAKKAGVKKIRVHDLRHSHISLLINKNYDAVTIGARVGHSSQYMTLHYAHLFAATEKRIANELNSLMGG